MDLLVVLNLIVWFELESMFDKNTSIGGLALLTVIVVRALMDKEFLESVWEFPGNVIWMIKYWFKKTFIRVNIPFELAYCIKQSDNLMPDDYRFILVRLCWKDYWSKKTSAKGFIDEVVLRWTIKRDLDEQIENRDYQI